MQEGLTARTSSSTHLLPLRYKSGLSVRRKSGVCECYELVLAEWHMYFCRRRPVVLSREPAPSSEDQWVPQWGQNGYDEIFLSTAEVIPQSPGVVGEPVHAFGTAGVVVARAESQVYAPSCKSRGKTAANASTSKPFGP